MSGKQCYSFTIIKRVNFHWRASICYKYKWCGISISVQSWRSQPTTRLWHKRLTWNCEVATPDTGLWFNIKVSSYQYRKSHCGDKTVIRSSYLHHGISYTGKIQYNSNCFQMKQHWSYGWHIDYVSSKGPYWINYFYLQIYHGSLHDKEYSIFLFYQWETL